MFPFAVEKEKEKKGMTLELKDSKLITGAGNISKHCCKDVLLKTVILGQLSSPLEKGKNYIHVLYYTSAVPNLFSSRDRSSYENLMAEDLRQS